MAVLADATLSSDTRTTAGILLLTLVAVEYGVVMLRMVRGRRPATPFQRSFARAGHAHAGVLVILALVGQILADSAALDGVDDFLGRTGIWLAAILFPAGFFLSSAFGVVEPIVDAGLSRCVAESRVVVLHQEVAAVQPVERLVVDDRNPRGRRRCPASDPGTSSSQEAARAVSVHGGAAEHQTRLVLHHALLSPRLN
jgi:hypothetical protein